MIINQLDSLIEEILAKIIPDEQPHEIVALSTQDADTYIEKLKQDADRHWAIDPNISLKQANKIILVGHYRSNTHHIALGLMARGDALKLLGRIREAWDMLSLAGQLYQSVLDDVGWARTCIGKLYISPDINQPHIALEDAQKARQIFIDHDEQEKLVRLELNVGYVYDKLGDWEQAIEIYSSTLEICERLGEAGRQYLGILHFNIGAVHSQMGNLTEAISCYQKAQYLFRVRNETGYLIYIDTNIAEAAMLQGRYRFALGLLHEIEDLTIDKLPMDYLIAQRIRTECYVELNWHLEAIKLAQKIAGTFRQLGTNQELGYILRHMAIALAESGDFDAAARALDEAQAIFTFNEARVWSADVTLKKAQIALKQGNVALAAKEIDTVQTYFAETSNQINLAQATLLRGQIAYARQEWQVAAAEAHQALFIARTCQLPDVNYSSHLLLGKIAEAQKNELLAINHYSAAVSMIEELQKELTISLRPDFLEDHEEAFHRMLSLLINRKSYDLAFEALERAKSTNILGHLTDKEILRWSNKNQRSNALLEKLTQLRLNHHQYYQQLHGYKAGMVSVDKDDLRHQLQECEERIREITQKLYLNQDHQLSRFQHSTRWQDVQAALDANTVLIEYYDNGDKLWAFVITDQGLNVRPLSINIKDVEEERQQLQFDLECVLKIGSVKGLEAAEIGYIAPLIRQRLEKLYTDLIAPLKEWIADDDRLFIVPFSALHYLPFNVLHTGRKYLIEEREIVLLPTSSLLTMPQPQKAPHVRVIAHSWGNRLAATLQEAKLIHEQTDAEMILEEAATRASLAAPAGQVLHIAAHGEHRVDHPDLSFIQLADGQLYADDLFQHDLSYELVVLSGCETGRSKVVPGDELIGLGRGFLYSGAAAILASLWQIPDDITVEFMQHFYSKLLKGASKAEALRSAQCALLSRYHNLNPAFWGAFQLMGSAAPLSAIKA